MAAAAASKRPHIVIYFVFLAVFVVIFISSFREQRHVSPSQEYDALWSTNLHKSGHQQKLDSSLLTGHAIAPKLGNETAKAELGRAAWKLFHTTFARFPDKPTPEEKAALKSYMHLFQRLYPCGECAAHFGSILEKHPPQVSSRSAAAAWGCMVHNEVNKSLDKELFDCAKIGDFYDCGCADEEDEADRPESVAHDDDEALKHKFMAKDSQPLEIQREEYQRGG